MTVEITEDADGERILQLTDTERLAVLADQVFPSVMRFDLMAHSCGQPVLRGSTCMAVLVLLERQILTSSYQGAGLWWFAQTARNL